ncbi:MAG: hypothetical protein WC975_09775 [Phycisphaerae bacterium]
MVRKSFRDILTLVVVSLAYGVVSGCATSGQGAKRLVEYQNQILQLKSENQKLTQQIVVDNQTIATQNQQIANLQRLGPERFAKLTRVASIQLDRVTGGYHEGAHAYDDGVVIYLQPFDGSGQAIKAAGSVRVRLFELTGEPRLVGEVNIRPDELEKMWISRFWTNHYAIRCPFSKRPNSAHITVHVDFMELLTGKPFAAEKLVDVKIPPTTVPATSGVSQTR